MKYKNGSAFENIAFNIDNWKFSSLYNQQREQHKLNNVFSQNG